MVPPSRYQNGRRQNRVQNQPIIQNWGVQNQPSIQNQNRPVIISRTNIDVPINNEDTLNRIGELPPQLPTGDSLIDQFFNGGSLY
jgi:hypothetical protein